jgi:2-oxo-3-hexenedioate decarboxylase
MVLEQSQIEVLAGEFLAVRASAGLIEQPTRRYPGFSLRDGYAVGEQLWRHRTEQEGYVPTGKKIGFTNQAIWPGLGIDSPIWATLYDRTVHDNTESLSLQGMAAPCIEPEIVFGLRKDLSGQNLQAEEILEAMEWYALGFEIVDCNFPGWKCTPADAAADFGLHAALVIGSKHPARPAFAKALAEFSVNLYKNDQLTAEGAGRNVLGSPALAINWLLNALKEAGIDGLKGGEIITTGTLTEALPIAPDETWRFEVNGLDLPPLSLKFT